MNSQPPVELAPLTTQHAEATFEWLKDPAISGALGLRRQVSYERTQEWLSEAGSDPSVLPFAILLDGAHVGNVIVDQIDHLVAAGRLYIYLGSEGTRGRGVGRRALNLALSHAFTERGLFKVWLVVHQHNDVAIKAYAESGFTVEGTLRGEFVLDGARIDAIRMSILAEEFVAA